MLMLNTWNTDETEIYMRLCIRTQKLCIVNRQIAWLLIVMKDNAHQIQKNLHNDKYIQFTKPSYIVKVHEKIC